MTDTPARDVSGLIERLRNAHENVSSARASGEVGYMAGTEALAIGDAIDALAASQAREAELREDNKRLQSKVDAFTNGDTFLYLRSGDQHKAACELTDGDLAKWSRWALVQAAALYDDDAVNKDRSVAEIVATHSVISLARMVHDSNADRASFSVDAASWPGKANGSGGSWVVTIARAALAKDHP